MKESVQELWNMLSNEEQQRVTIGFLAMVGFLLMGGFNAIEKDRQLDNLCGDDRSRCILISGSETCFPQYGCEAPSHWEPQPQVRDPKE